MKHEYIDDNGEVQTGVFVRTPYNYDMDKASDASGLDASVEPTLAQQQFREETDINTIVERFGLTGQLPQNVRVPLPEDFIEATDYHTALNQLIAANESFMQMPADVRARFQNDPGKFLDFVHDDKNRDEAQKLGILVPQEPAKPPIDVRVVPDTNGAA